MSDGDEQHKARKADWVAAVVLVLCVGVVAFWELMARRSSRPWDAFSITSEDFEDFRPASPGWRIERLPVPYDPVEPNILAFRMQRADRSTKHSGVLARLVHGYNMVDCMRIKRYEVEALKVEGGISLPAPQIPQHQLWRLTSSVGDESVWATTMLRAGDFADTDIDTRSMAFPNVGVPDQPGWLPRGLTWRSFRRPVRNLRQFLRSKWNSSRRDLLTFLRLRQPAWASDELLTLVTAWHGAPLQPGQEQAAAREVMAAHAFMFRELRAWRAERMAEKL